MIYEKPELEELELQLEGSFLQGNSVAAEKGTDEAESDEWD